MAPERQHLGAGGSSARLEAPTGGRPIAVVGRGPAVEHATQLLETFGLRVSRESGRDDPAPALLWARSGAMALTGAADGPPLAEPAGAAVTARGAALAIDALCDRSAHAMDGPALLGEKAAFARLERRGAVSPGGRCRMLRCGDGWLALNLARTEDEELLPALLEGAATAGEQDDLWTTVAAAVASRSVSHLVERARLLGLPAAAVGAHAAREPWLRIAARGPQRDPRHSRSPDTLLVIDLTSLWAGPLCGSLLGSTGARVVKLESEGRPDGARRGSPRFFDLLNAGKESVVLDFAGAAGSGRLRAIVDAADVVVESSRPRALAQLGIDAEAWLQAGAGRTWVSITGYGRGEPEAGWVAFGDDAAAAAGLVARAGDGAPFFCGDAIADPLAGLHAAAAALSSQRAGGGHLLDVALTRVAAAALHAPAPADHEVAVTRCEEGYLLELDGGGLVVAPPRARTPLAVATAFGADTERVLAEIAPGC